MDFYQLPPALQELVHREQCKFARQNRIQYLRGPESGGAPELLHDGFAVIYESMEYAYLAALDYLAGPEEVPSYSLKLAAKCTYRIMRACKPPAIRRLIADGELLAAFFEAAVAQLRPGAGS